MLSSRGPSPRRTTASARKGRSAQKLPFADGLANGQLRPQRDLPFQATKALRTPESCRRRKRQRCEDPPFRNRLRTGQIAPLGSDSNLDEAPAMRSAAYQRSKRGCRARHRLESAGPSVRPLPPPWRPRARGFPSSWPRLLARRPRSSGPSAGRSSPRSTGGLSNRCPEPGAEHVGGELPSLVLWPGDARRPSSRPRKAPRRRHGRR